MKTNLWLKIEGAAVFILFTAFLIANFGFSWILIIAFFAPDITMIGYIFGPKIGAWIYNLGHSYATPLALLAISYFARNQVDISLHMGIYIAFLWFAHIGFDRMLGFGLKEVTGFKDTHLGKIGKK